MELARQSRLCPIIQRDGGLAFLSLDPGHSEQSQNDMRVSVEVRADLLAFCSDTLFHAGDQRRPQYPSKRTGWPAASAAGLCHNRTFTAAEFARIPSVTQPAVGCAVSSKPSPSFRRYLAAKARCAGALV